LPSREPTPFALIAALLIVAVTVVGGVLLLMAARPAPVIITINPPPPTPTIAPTATPAPLAVYVTGAVNKPGSVVTLPAGSRIQDALAAAGGAAPDADLDRVDLAAMISDGQQIHVYRHGEPAQMVDPSQSSTASDSASTAVVHVNHASLEQLETLPGIGPALAQRIIDYRTANGNFTTLESLTAVSGIGEHTIQLLTGLVAFD